MTSAIIIAATALCVIAIFLVYVLNNVVTELRYAVAELNGIRRTLEGHAPPGS